MKTKPTLNERKGLLFKKENALSPEDPDYVSSKYNKGLPIQDFVNRTQDLSILNQDLTILKEDYFSECNRCKEQGPKHALEMDDPILFYFQKRLQRGTSDDGSFWFYCEKLK